MFFKKIVTPATYIPIGGTWSWDEDENHYQWWERGSTLTRQLSGLGLVLHARNPFEWSTDIDGDLFHKNKTVWKAAGKHLACHVERVPLEERNMICHSHGGQVLFYCAYYGVKFNHVITVGTPVRNDMKAIVMAAKPNLGYWHHIMDSKTDWMAVAGGIFDGGFGIRHDFDQADSRSDIKGIGHSAILNDEKAMHYWEDSGWASILAYGKEAFLDGPGK